MQERTATTIHSRPVHDGRVFQVRTDRVRLPNGSVTTVDVIRHPASVILVPMPDPDLVVLVRQYRYAVDRWLWELPAGNVEPGEDPVAAARRECAEETGRSAATVERIGAFYPTPGYCDEEMIFYRLSRLRPHPATSSTWTRCSSHVSSRWRRPGAPLSRSRSPT